MDAINQMNSANVLVQTHVFALKKGREAQAETILSLIQDANQVKEAVKASNPAHLGQSIDVKA